MHYQHFYGYSKIFNHQIRRVFMKDSAMTIEVLDDPDQALIDYLDKKIADFNWAHWEVISIALSKWSKFSEDKNSRTRRAIEQ
jgi:hypothetical protein